MHLLCPDFMNSDQMLILLVFVSPESSSEADKLFVYADSMLYHYLLTKVSLAYTPNNLLHDFSCFRIGKMYKCHHCLLGILQPVLVTSRSIVPLMGPVVLSQCCLDFDLLLEFHIVEQPQNFQFLEEIKVEKEKVTSYLSLR